MIAADAASSPTFAAAGALIALVKLEEEIEIKLWIFLQAGHGFLGDGRAAATSFLCSPLGKLQPTFWGSDPETPVAGLLPPPLLQPISGRAGNVLPLQVLATGAQLLATAGPRTQSKRQTLLGECNVTPRRAPLALLSLYRCLSVGSSPSLCLSTPGNINNLVALLCSARLSGSSF